MTGILAILLALFMAFVVFRFVVGVAKFVIIGVIVLAVGYFVMNGGLA
jgi:hypothetical protein